MVTLSRQDMRFNTALVAEYLGRMVEKKFLGGKFVRVGPMLTVGVFLFEMGAILGYAFRDRLQVFALPFAAKDDGPDAVERMSALGKKAYAASRPEAKTLNELVMVWQMRQEDASLPHEHWPQWFMAQGNEKLDVEVAFQTSVMFGVAGAGFGAEFPDAFEALYAKSYASDDPETWREAHKYGVVDTAEQPELVPLGDRVTEAKEGFAEFCQEYFPQLMEPLGLTPA